mgnify:CR=1 FL=1
MMKKIEYFLNLIHYGFYIFFKISERGIDPFTFNDEAGKKVDGMLVSRGIGACFGGGISLILFSICFIINKNFVVCSVLYKRYLATICSQGAKLRIILHLAKYLG